MIPRYTTPEMAALWTDANKFRKWLDVELAVIAAWEELGVLPDKTHSKLEKKSAAIDFDALPARVEHFEKTTQHDVIAFLHALEEVLGDSARPIHLGLTSSDVVDSAFALLLMQAGTQLAKRLDGLVDVLEQQAKQHRDTRCLGRTHGQAAQVTTFGLKMLSYVAEFQRHRERLAEATREIGFGKLSGAVGNYGNVDPKIEKIALKALGLQVETVSTQIIPRDRHAVFFTTLAVIAGGLERLAVEIRHLMRTEVAEAFEPFKKGQKGSSAMPHKKNPILTENITGLARLIRGYAVSAMENQALWHERDISHSSVERVIAPDATTALDFALSRMTRVIEGLVIDKETMQKHVDEVGDILFSESVLLELVKRGVMRQQAYGWVQEAAMQARDKKTSLLVELKLSHDVKAHLKDKQLTDLLSADRQLTHVDVIYQRVHHEQPRKKTPKEKNG